MKFKLGNTGTALLLAASLAASNGCVNKDIQETYKAESFVNDMFQNYVDEEGNYHEFVFVEPEVVTRTIAIPSKTEVNGEVVDVITYKTETYHIAPTGYMMTEVDGKIVCYRENIYPSESKLGR